MAFDACMMSAVVWELRHTLLGARVEKVKQPKKEEIILTLHRDRKHFHLLFDAGGSTPRVSLTDITRENPPDAPVFCMQLRKNLGSAHLTDISQPGFERAVRLTFDGFDEMGFPCRRYVICEVMGKYSNFVLTDADDKILGVLRPVDFSTSQKRQLLAGMKYRLPPAQEKADPRDVTEEAFLRHYTQNGGELSPERFLTESFCGIARVTAREIVHLSKDQTPQSLYQSFSALMTREKNGDFTPVMVRDADGRPAEYGCFSLSQYADPYQVETFSTFGELLDTFFADRDRVDTMHQRASDLFRLLTNARNRLQKKIVLLREDLAESASCEEARRMGDLITANLYRIKRGDTNVTLIDYYADDLPQVQIKLDAKLSPSQNAQQYYKKYNKAQTAQRELTRQIAIAQAELNYLSTVQDALERSSTESELADLRAELAQSGYASQMRNVQKWKIQPSKPMRFVSSAGLEILCGRNNIQNDRLTFRLSQKTDYWFHVKNAPGSHVILLCDGKMPDNASMTEAAVIAATHSSLYGNDKVPVDYTPVRNLKKPPASRPGYVTYSTNQTAYVIPDRALCERLKKQ